MIFNILIQLMSLLLKTINLNKWLKMESLSVLHQARKSKGGKRTREFICSNEAVMVDRVSAASQVILAHGNIDVFRERKKKIE